MTKAIITQAELKEQLHYDPETGIFTWLSKRFGKIAGTTNKYSGYVVITIKQYKIQAHRLAWLYVNGYMPKIIDHINGKRNDNRVCNLRDCLQYQNMCNIKMHISNTSGFKGVDYVKRLNKFRARCRFKGIRYDLGLFSNALDANLAYQLFSKKHHGEFYRQT